MKTNAPQNFLDCHNILLFLGIMLATVILSAGCQTSPLSIYDFDDGTTQGWKLTAVADDQQNFYTPFFDLLHSGKKTNSKKGHLLISGGQFGPWAKLSGFPEKTSKYWELTAYYTGLYAYKSNLWQGIKGVEVDVMDEYGMGVNPVLVNIGVRVEIAGKDKNIMEVGTQGKPLFHPINHASTGKWSHLKANLNIPSNATVNQVWIKFRGSLNPGLYEGFLYIDNVKPIKSNP